MNYIKLGNTGLDVSPICLGCMSFGDPSVWITKWVINEEESRAIIKRALDLGINFFDTANVYSLGISEEYLGRAIRDFANRDRVVIATKVFNKMDDGPNGSGLSRKAILSEIDKSLKRLGMDYVDLYIVHRWDYKTPIEETMAALHDVVKSGKARYIGASAMYAWQFLKAQYVAEKYGYTRFISMQNHYNLIYREEEREMIPLCKELGVAITPYSPLAGGRLCRDLNESTQRLELDDIGRKKYDGSREADALVVERQAAIAKKRGISRTQVALAWMRRRVPGVVPIVGATKVAHLEDAVAALSVELTAEEMESLEQMYIPHKVVGPL
jgi:aryl-alcohol dehydrogenase-like predicted oxidoreductase